MNSLLFRRSKKSLLRIKCLLEPRNQCQGGQTLNYIGPFLGVQEVKGDHEGIFCGLHFCECIHLRHRWRHTLVPRHLQKKFQGGLEIDGGCQESSGNVLLFISLNSIWDFLFLLPVLFLVHYQAEI